MGAFKALFLITAADPVGPGLPCANLSVNISMDLCEVPSWKFFMYSSVLSPSFGSTVVNFGMKKTSWIDEISEGMTICSKSNFRVFERCMRSVLQSDVKCISGVA